MCETGACRSGRVAARRPVRVAGLGANSDRKRERALRRHPESANGWRQRPRLRPCGEGARAGGGRVGGAGEKKEKKREKERSVVIRSRPTAGHNGPGSGSLASASEAHQTRGWKRIGRSGTAAA